MGFQSDRRTLNDIKLLPPDYRVPDKSILIHGYLEKEIKVNFILFLLLKLSLINSEKRSTQKVKIQ